MKKWDGLPFKNKIRDIEAELKRVHQDLEINRISYRDNNLLAVYTSFKQKGGKGIKDKLELLGWEYVRKEMYHNSYKSISTGSLKGNDYFMLTMIFRL